VSQPDEPERSRDEETAKPSPGVVLTRAELVILAALEDLTFELGYAPTYAQMLERIEWRSAGSLHAYLQRLRDKGVVEGRGRSLRVVR
jgi:SOS-response transcriptional repressor LexA